MVDFASVRLTTERLELRPFTEADDVAVFGIYTHAEIPLPPTRARWTEVAQARERIAKDIRDMNAGTAIRLALARRKDGRVLGDCCLFNFNVQCRRAELGYALARDVWGAGYMGEALRAFVKCSFEELGLLRIEATIDPRNQRSARSLERLGFVKEGQQRERWIVDGDVSDSALYGLLRREWAAAGSFP